MNFTSLIKLLLAALLLGAVTLNNPLKKQAIPTATAEQCNAANIFFEARGETMHGMQAVAEVVNNRTKAKGYPSEVCAVIFQKKQFSWTHQQNFMLVQKVLKGDLSGFTAKDRQAYQMAITAASRAATGVGRVLPAGALWYHTKEVNPCWTNGLRKVKIIQSHVFYVKK